MKYHRELLHEEYIPASGGFTRYKDAVDKQINAALIIRNDFDTTAILSGL